MKDQKEKILIALTTKHIESIKQLQTINGGNIVICEDFPS